MVRCGGCRRELEAGASGGATRCCHLLCAQCAGAARAAGECPACGAALAPGADLREVEVRRDPRDADVALLGQTVEFALSSCLAVFRCEEQQQYLELQLQADEERQALEARYADMEGKYRAKLEEVYAGYQQYRAKCKKLAAEQDGLAQDRRELQEKYAEKTEVVRKLQEKCHQQHEELKRLRRGQPSPQAQPASAGQQAPFHADGAGGATFAAVNHTVSFGLQGALAGSGAPDPTGRRGSFGAAFSPKQLQGPVSPGPGPGQRSPYFPGPPKLDWQRKRGAGGLGVPHEAFPMFGGAAAHPGAHYQALAWPGGGSAGSPRLPGAAMDPLRRSSSSFQAVPSSSYLSV